MWRWHILSALFPLGPLLDLQCQLQRQGWCMPWLCVCVGWTWAFDNCFGAKGISAAYSTCAQGSDGSLQLFKFLYVQYNCEFMQGRRPFQVDPAANQQIQTTGQASRCFLFCVFGCLVRGAIHPRLQSWKRQRNFWGQRPKLENGPGYSKSKPLALAAPN